MSPASHHYKQPGKLPTGFKSAGSVKETHGKQIYSVSWSKDLYGQEEQRQVFATCGGNVVSVYEVHADQKHGIVLRQGYVDASSTECFYACVFGGRSLGRPLGYGPLTLPSGEGMVLAGRDDDDNNKQQNDEELRGRKRSRKNDMKVTESSAEYQSQDTIRNTSSSTTTTTGAPPTMTTASKSLLEKSTTNDIDSDKLYQSLIDTSKFDGPQLLCVAGTGAVIKVIDVCRRMLYTTLSSHGSDIYDLKFSPVDEWILLSASKDESLRMWNVKTSTCIAIFAGHEGHRDCVLSMGWHSKGHQFVSGGMDTTIKIWNVGEGSDVYDKIQKSKIVQPKRWDERVDPASKFLLLYEQMPIFSTNKVHTDYVDAIQFVGDLVLSKDTNETVILWKPITTKANRGGNAKTQQRLPSEVIALREFTMNKCDVWFIRFDTDHKCQMLALGNMIGEIKIWHIGSRPTKKHFCNLIHPYCTATIRMVSFNYNNKYLVAVGDDATVWLWEAVSSKSK